MLVTRIQVTFCENSNLICVIDGSLMCDGKYFSNKKSSNGQTFELAVYFLRIKPINIAKCLTFSVVLL